MIEYKVYQATHRPTRKIYVGCTKVPLLKRIGQHLGLTEYKRTTFQTFLHTTRYEEWDWEVLYVVGSAREMYKLEAEIIRDMIARDVDLLNTLGVERTKVDPTPWLSTHQFKSGKEPWNKGKTEVYSKDTIYKMRLAKLRKPPHNPISASTIAKIQRLQGKPIVCVETGEQYPSIGAAAAKLKIARSGIRNVLKGKAGHVNGLTFKYLTKEELTKDS